MRPVKIAGLATYVPPGASNQVLFTLPGIASYLPPKSGTHHEWMTSQVGALIRSFTTRSAGATSVSIEIAPNTEVQMQRSAIQTLLPKGTIKSI